MKNWSLLGVLLAFGLLFSPLYASPPDPGGKVASIQTVSFTPDFLAGGTVERTTAVVPAFESATFAKRAALTAVALVGTGTILILLAVIIAPLFYTALVMPIPGSIFDTTRSALVPERYDKATNKGQLLGSKTADKFGVKQFTGRFRRQSS